MILWDRINLPYVHGTDLRNMFSDHFGTCKCLTSDNYIPDGSYTKVKQNKTETIISNKIGYDNQEFAMNNKTSHIRINIPRDDSSVDVY